MNRYCVACHGENKQKGKVRLDALATLAPEARVDLLTKAQEALHFEEMPPVDEKQPTAAERKVLSEWVRGELAKAGFAGSDCFAGIAVGTAVGRSPLG